MPVFRLTPVLFLSLVVFLGSACGRYQGSDEAEHDHPRLVRARERLDAQDPEGALVLIEEVIRSNPDMAYPHLMAGNVYQTLQNRVSAIHHFQRYLALREDSALAAEVEALIQNETFRLLDSHPSILAMRPPEVVRLQEEIEDLRSSLGQARDQIARQSMELESLRRSGGAPNANVSSAESPRVAVLEARVEELRRENERLRGGNLATAPSRAGEASSNGQNAGQRTYVVQRNDTLSGISQKMYNTPNRWRDIYEANRNVLPAPERLSPGQTLVIP